MTCVDDKVERVTIVTIHDLIPSRDSCTLLVMSSDNMLRIITGG